MASSRCPVVIILRCFLLPLIHGAVASIGGNLSQVFRAHNVSFSPANILQLKEGTTADIKVSLAFERTDDDDRRGIGGAWTKNSSTVSLCYRPDDPAVAWASNDTGGTNCFNIPVEEFRPANLTADDRVGPPRKSVYLADANISMKGIFLGKTNVIVEVFVQEADTSSSKNQQQPMIRRSFLCSVIRDNNRLQHIFVGTLSLLLIVANVLMGAQLNLDTVLAVVKMPLAPGIGFVCQYIFMPLISYALAWILFVPAGLSALGLGMFTTGCSPGGGASNGYTVLMDGNVDLSITMTFISTVAALVMMPFWMFVLGRTFLLFSDLPSQHINIPFTNICYSLIVLVVPLIVGAVIRKYNQKLAERANKILRPMLLIVIVFICTFGVYANFYMFRLMTWRVLVAGMCLPSLGFLFGTLSALAFKQPLANIKAIAIETGIQNTGIGIVLLQLSFSQPDADLAAVVPVVVAMFTPPPLLIALAVHYVRKYRANAKKLDHADDGVEQLDKASLENGGNNIPIRNCGGPNLGTISDDETSYVGSTCLRQNDSALPLFPLGGSSSSEPNVENFHAAVNRAVERGA